MGRAAARARDRCAGNSC